MVVYNKTQFEKALENRAKEIIFEGPEAAEIVRKLREAQKKRSNARGWALGLGAICLLAAPFTGGGSLLGLGATAGATALSETVILAIIGGVIALSKKAIDAIKEYKIHELDSTRVQLTRN